MRTEETTFKGIGSYFSWDHRRLGEMLAALRETAKLGDHEAAERAFTHFARSLRRHLHVEEDLALQLFAFDRTGNAKATPQKELAEHGDLLTALAGVDHALAARDQAELPRVLDRLEGLLRLHGAREEREVYPLVESLLGPVESQRVVDRLRAK